MKKSSITSLIANWRKLIIPQKATTPKALKFLQNNFKKHLTKRWLCVIIKTEKRKGETKMTYVDTAVRLHINYSNRTIYRTCASAWSGNLIALAIMRDDKAVETIYITDTETGELLKIYKRGWPSCIFVLTIERLFDGRRKRTWKSQLGKMHKNHSFF